jgi:hypothetical protein
MMETEINMATPPRPSLPPSSVPRTASQLMFSPALFASPFMDRTQAEGTPAGSVKSSVLEPKSNVLQSIVASGLHPIGDGTKEHPYIVVVDLKFPERNRKFGIERVSNISHASYTRNAFHIRLPVAVPDYDQWDATIPNKYPILRQRVVEISGPSMCFWTRHTERYHTKLDCEATKKKHAVTELEIIRNPLRQRAHWLLVFPECITLDNQVFSSDLVNVDTGFNPMTSEPNETACNKKLYGMAVSWIIAEIGGNQFEVGKPKPNPKQLFD